MTHTNTSIGRRLNIKHRGFFFFQKGNYSREDKIGSTSVLNLRGVPSTVQSQKWLSYQLELAGGYGIFRGYIVGVDFYMSFDS